MTDVIQTIDQYSIARRCLLVSLTISAWSGRKFDRAASTAVEQENSTAEGRARVNKLLVRPEVLLPVNRAANALRNAVYEGTLPWADSGDRIVTAAAYPALAMRLGPLVTAFHNAADALEAEYRVERERARFDLNALFKESDYPAQVRDKFHARITVMPIPDTQDLRLDLPDLVKAAIQESVTESIEERQQQAMRLLWETLGTSLVAIRDRLADSEPRFKTALITNFYDLVDRLGALNIGGDPQIAALQQQARSSLGTFDPAELRSDPAQRVEFVEQADTLIDTFKSMWGG